MTEITGLGDLVHRVLARLGSGPPGAGFTEPIRRGSAAGTLCVSADADDPGDYLLQVRMGVMRVPPGREAALFRRLVELNDGLGGRAALALGTDGVVSLLAARPVLDLDASEVVDLILWTSEQADRLDDLLLTEFGYEHAL